MDVVDNNGAEFVEDMGVIDGCDIGVNDDSGIGTVDNKVAGGGIKVPEGGIWVEDGD